MTIKGVAYDDKKTAGERLVLACSGDCPTPKKMLIGSYRGFELSLRFDTFRSEYQARSEGAAEVPGAAWATDPLRQHHPSG